LDIDIPDQGILAVQIIIQLLFLVCKEPVCKDVPEVIKISRGVLERNTG
jgi:hypothetical protein